ncbi:anaphase promoting complex subunit [Striga asiatica]|uniref:Anaphase-promoting complex subunit 4 n=1 Tax=Striga asiatica TaxID=4170 RepID=A0A5A7PGE5_STRAF|nr:anaphase promoting complex subunit [Striga asiatica]
MFLPVCSNLQHFMTILFVQHLHNLALRSSLEEKHVSCQLTDASICYIVLCSGVATENGSEGSDDQISGGDISVFPFRSPRHYNFPEQNVFLETEFKMHHVSNWIKKNERYEVAQQASNVEHMMEGIKRSAKVGSDDSTWQSTVEFSETSIEIIAFRMGVLRGLSKWRACYLGMGLHENLIDHATWKTGKLLVQIERIIRILSSVVQHWLLKCVKVLMSEPNNQLLPFSSGLSPAQQIVSIFPVNLFQSESDQSIEVDL